MLANHSEAIVSVRGKDKFVVMAIAQYNYLRECELEAALAEETRADLAEGRLVQESEEAHVSFVIKSPLTNVTKLSLIEPFSYDTI